MTPGPSRPPPEEAPSSAHQVLARVRRLSTAMAARRTSSWLLWGGILVVATIVLRAHRTELDSVHVVLAYLLIALGGSISGGRPLGLALTLASVGLIDYYFQVPYNAISVTKPLDLVVLVAFLTTAGVATQLLAWERARAAEAELRASEVTALGRLGAEMLSAGRAEETLTQIAGVIRSSVEVARCEIYGWGDGAMRLLAASPLRPVEEGPEAPNLESLYHLIETAPERSPDLLATGSLQRNREDPRALATVLRAHDRAVGALWLADTKPLTLDAAERRFLGALAYYAALAVERAQLVAAAEYAEALQEANRLKDVVLASVSHDLRTPLTTIKALAQDAARHGDRHALVIEEQADRLSHFVGELLDLSRLRSGTLAMRPELNTAEDLVGAALRQVSGVAAGRTIEAQLDLSEPALVGRFDFVHALRILCNLLENALRYVPPPSPIELDARREGPDLVFAVADRGPGIPASERERVFEPFYRPPNASADGGGAGLGLAIARQLAELQRGTVTYLPRPGGGSIFELRLPASDLAGPEPVEESASLKQRRSG